LRETQTPRLRAVIDTDLGRHAIGAIGRFIYFRLAPKLQLILWRKPRNRFFSIVLNAEGFEVGSRPRIRNQSRISIGSHFKALDQLWLETIESPDRHHPRLIIGNYVRCSDSVHIAATNRIAIGNHVLIGSRVIITDHNHGLYRGTEQSDPSEPPWDRLLTADGETTVEDNVWIGDGVAVLPGAHIGCGSVIGANSVVLGEIPRYCIAAGSPARPIRRYDFMAKLWVNWDESEIKHPIHVPADLELEFIAMRAKRN
jgi:lipopolysaccharide O-acetyltransferase